MRHAGGYDGAGVWGRFESLKCCFMRYVPRDICGGSVPSSGRRRRRLFPASVEFPAKRSGQGARAAISSA